MYSSSKKVIHNILLTCDKLVSVIQSSGQHNYSIEIKHWIVKASVVTWFKSVTVSA